MSAQPFGAACSAVPKTGKGSFDGMSSDPVATAASNNPLLSTLVTAVKTAGLVDTLNNAENITVFAPTNDAFAKIDKATLDKVLADKATLTAILTEHVVGQRLGPDMVAGEFDTLNPKQGVSVEGSGEDFTVNGSATGALWQRADRERDGLHHRHGAPAEVVVPLVRTDARRTMLHRGREPEANPLAPVTRASTPGTLSVNSRSQFGKEPRNGNPTTGSAPNNGQASARNAPPGTSGKVHRDQHFSARF